MRDADEIALQLKTFWQWGEGEFRMVADVINAAQREAWNEAIDAAAKVADSAGVGMWSIVAAPLAADIRALKRQVLEKLGMK